MKLRASLIALLFFLPPAGAEAGSAKILIYHHIAIDTPAATSVTPEVFDSHLSLLERGGYEVVPLQTIVDTLVAGDALRSNWVAITFDDAYRSVRSIAAPLLRQRGWSFTVFVSTDYVESGGSLYLGWDDLRALELEGASIANHSRTHDHLVRHLHNETEEDWKRRVAADVMHAQHRLESELDHPLRVFAYPYGEFDAAFASLMTSLGFIALGQQSGPVGVGTSPYAIPRFPLARGFDDLQSVQEKLNTEYLPLADPPIPGSLLTTGAAVPLLRLQLAEGEERPETLTCFVNGQPNAQVRWIDPGSGTIEIEAREVLRPGRSKYTCTAPVQSRPGVYYWYTHLWMKPFADGSWYDN